MNVLHNLGAITGMIFTMGSMLTLWVFSAASLANNTSADSLQRVKLWVLCLSLYCMAGIAAGIWLLCIQRSGWATVASLLPAASMAALLLYLVLRP